MYLVSGARNLAALVYEFKSRRSRVDEVVVFASFGIFAPLVLSVVIAIIEPNYGKIVSYFAAGSSTSLLTSAQRSLALAAALMVFFFPLVGLVLQATMGFGQLLKQGYLFFYLFFIIPGLLGLFGVSQAVGFWVSNGLFAVLLLLLAVFVPTVRKSLALFMRTRTFLLILVSGALIYALTYGLVLGGSAIVPTQPYNQVQLSKRPLVQTIVAAVLIAPFVEEFMIRRTVIVSFRGGFMTEALGALVACFFFAFLHIRDAND